MNIPPDSIIGQEWSELAESYDRTDGFTYALTFSDGITKVGRTINPYGRLNAHRRVAEKRGVFICRWWMSKRHDLCSISERKLIAAAHEIGTLVDRCEYFTGCDDLLELIALAETIPTDDVIFAHRIRFKPVEQSA